MADAAFRIVISAAAHHVPDAVVVASQERAAVPYQLRHAGLQGAISETDPQSCAGNPGPGTRAGASRSARCRRRGPSRVVWSVVLRSLIRNAKSRAESRHGNSARAVISAGADLVSVLSRRRSKPGRCGLGRARARPRLRHDAGNAVAQARPCGHDRGTPPAPGYAARWRTRDHLRGPWSARTVAPVNGQPGRAAQDDAPPAVPQVHLPTLPRKLSAPNTASGALLR
jgi:hypothetical protein